MGCANSSAADTAVSKDRKRLSVAHGEGDGVDVKSGNNGQQEDYRGVIAQLSEQNIIEMINALDESQGGGANPVRRRSIASQTDKGSTSFANKTITQAGDGTADMAGIGFTCRKGLKPDSPNQDSWFVLQMEDLSIYAVFDGHGAKGHDVSNFAKDVLPKIFFKEYRNGKAQESKTQDIAACLTSAFKETQQLIVHSDKARQLVAQMSGTTATVAIHDHLEQTLTVGHVADSTCVLAEKKADSYEKVLVTQDHKPNLKDEKARIEAAGGRVVFDGYANWRVYAKNARYPGLNMSRCLGDLLGHAECGMSCEPEITKVNIQPGKEHLLLVCSDGVWEFMEPQDALLCVKSFPPAKAQNAADALAKEAWDRWIKEEGGTVVDDITVVLVHLGKENVRND